MTQQVRTYTATFTGNVIVECWGSGASGTPGTSTPDKGGGGGAGAYSRKAGIPVVITTGYTVLIGIGGQAAGFAVEDGDFSIFHTSSCRAEGGGQGALNIHEGGKATGGVGDVKFDGGNSSPPPGGAGTGLGGGAAGGRNGNGANHVATVGGVGVAEAGSGGNGGPIDTEGQRGVDIGGGAGGAGSSTGAVVSGGDGADGAVAIWEDLGVWPPVGQTKLAAWIGAGGGPTGTSDIPDDPSWKRRRAAISIM